MGEIGGVTLSLALPWIAGTLLVRMADRADAPSGWAFALGHGYVIGAFATTLVMRLLSVTGIVWSLASIGVPLLVLGGVAGFLAHRRGTLALPREPLAAVRSLPRATRAVFWGALALVVVRLASLALEVGLRPLLPFDAWAHWGTKARVWYEYLRLVPFVQPATWLELGDPMLFTDYHPGYPGTVPMLQAWTAVAIGHWDVALTNVPWIALGGALACAFHAQARRLGESSARAMLFTYLLLSLPFLDIHIALAGCADIFVAACYGLTAMAAWRWMIERDRSQAVLACVLAVATALVKVEGILWVATLVPGIVMALNRRAGFALLAVALVSAIGYLALGPQDLRIFGFYLTTRFSNVSRPVLEHFFAMDNWHLLFPATIVVLVAYHRVLWSRTLAPMSATMVAAAAFVVVVFFFSNASMGVQNETLVNRLPLHAVPALVFYGLMVLREGRKAEAMRSTQQNANVAAL